MKYYKKTHENDKTHFSYACIVLGKRKRILYRVAPGERAEVKGSEIVIGWKLAKGSKTVWTVTLPNSFFAGHIPFDKIGSTLPAAER